MKLLYFINYVCLIYLTRCDKCSDDPLFRKLCKQEYCDNPETYETCPETCGACTGARSVNLFGDRLYEEGQKCDSNVESILRCEHLCVIRGNKPTCECFDGFKIQSDKTSCKDINECSSRSICPEYENCQNHEGGYSCEAVNQLENCPFGDKTDQFGGCCAVTDQFQCGFFDDRKADFSNPIMVNKESSVDWPWLVMVLGYRHKANKKFVICPGLIINDGEWVITDGSCIGGASAKDIEIFSDFEFRRNSLKNPFSIQYVTHEAEKTLTLIKITKNERFKSICMPEGEETDPYHKCISVELNGSNRRNYLNREYVSQSQSGCDRFKSNFEHLKRDFGSLPSVFCTGHVEYDSRCDIIETEGRVLMCKRCDTCQWYAAGLQKFAAKCPGQDKHQYVRAYHDLETSERWIRDQAPYTYSHRQNSCNDDECCSKITVDYNGIKDIFDKTGDDYKHLRSGRLLKPVSNNIFNGWRFEHFGNEVSLAYFGNTKCPNSVSNWFYQNGGHLQRNLEISCQTQSSATWSQWSNWSTKCSCRFGGIHRTRECLTKKCNGYDVEVKMCPELKCSNCCGEIEIQLPNNPTITKSKQLITVDRTFYLTEQTDNDRPIYEAKNKKSYLRPYVNTFWIVIADIDSADFLFFNEDKAVCPGFTNQMNWNYKVGNDLDVMFLKDNRINFKCKQHQIRKVASTSTSNKGLNDSRKPLATNDDPKFDANGCCLDLKIEMPVSYDAESYMKPYQNQGFKGESYYYENLSGRAIRKLGSLWGVETKFKSGQYKAYVGGDLKCPENGAGNWLMMSGGKWINQPKFKVTCAQSFKGIVTTKSTTTTRLTTTTIRKTKPTISSRSDGCCHAYIFNGPGIVNDILFADKTRTDGYSWKNEKQTFSYLSAKYFVYGYNYSITEVKCYAAKTKTAGLCPDNNTIIGWKCLVNGVWTSAELSVKCSMPSTTQAATTSTITTTRKSTVTTPATIRTTSKAKFITTFKPSTTTRPMIKGKTAEGCCKQLLIQNHQIPNLPNDYFVSILSKDQDSFENKWTNEGVETEYSIHWYSTSSTSYWVFSREFSSSAVKCYIRPPNNMNRNCPEIMPSWNCYIGGKWVTSDTFKVKCADHTIIKVTSTTLIPATVPRTTKKPVPTIITTSTPKPTTGSTLKITRQAYDDSGCCKLIQLYWSAQLNDVPYDVTGKYKRIFNFYRSQFNRDLELKRMKTYYTLMESGQNRLHASAGPNQCPESVSRWQYFYRGDWRDDMSIRFECITDHSVEYDDEYEPEENDYELVEETTTETTTWTTTTLATTTMTTTQLDTSLDVWAPWNQCTSTCRGIQTRKSFSSEIPEQVRPCGEPCAELSNWFAWSECSSWCGMGERKRRRLCVKSNELSNECQEENNERFSSQTCYLRPCPDVNAENCCHAMSVRIGYKSPLNGIYRLTSSSKGIKYKHVDHDFFIHKEHHSKWAIGLDTASITPFTVIGSSGRTKCPVSVDRWHSQSLDEQIFLEFGHSDAVKVECGSVWSEWSKPDSNVCGDRFRYRKRLDDFGIAEKETQNIGEKCEQCRLSNLSELCDIYQASGYCRMDEFSDFMKENCPMSCCYFTGDYSFR